MGYKGQMIVSSHRIMANKKSLYEHLKEILESDLDHWIHDDPREEMFDDSLTNPYFGHTLERSWMILFGCSDPRLEESCSWLKTRRGLGESLERCQCLDVLR